MKETFKKIQLKGNIQINLDERGIWSASKEDILNAIVDIVENYEAQGYTLTLRQLYYQLVSKDAIPNHDKVYKKLSSLKDDLCYGGYLDWSIFEDRGRIPHLPYFEHSVEDALQYTADTYRIDRQKNQYVHLEVWVEKDAISSILKRVTNEYGVYLVVNKGYSSSTAMYNAYKRFMQAIRAGKKVAIKYFGDHDPSGLDMVRDIYERIMYFFVNGDREEDDTLIDNWIWIDEANLKINPEAAHYYKDADCQNKYGFDPVKAFFKHHFTVEQIGLTMSQITQFQPPPNPAKITDPRAADYIKEFGQVSWEVDALPPPVMEAIVKNSIRKTIDMTIYAHTLRNEALEKETIKELISKL